MPWINLTPRRGALPKPVQHAVMAKLTEVLMWWITSSHPDARGEIKRVFADGDHVILHSHWHGLSDNPLGEAVVDIFRPEGGKVLEHWT
jgi:predicted SnoaL-like aldol condensation-catalyzing enzyme